MTLQQILFGHFYPPAVARTYKHRLDIATVQTREFPVGNTRIAILDLVRDNPGMSAREITDSLGVKYGTVMQVLIRMMSRRQLRRVKHGASYKYFAE